MAEDPKDPKASGPKQADFDSAGFTATMALANLRVGIVNVVRQTASQLERANWREICEEIEDYALGRPAKKKPEPTK